MMKIDHVGIALPEVPFGGVKESGYGSEGGSEAIESYLDPKLVTQRMVQPRKGVRTIAVVSSTFAHPATERAQRQSSNANQRARP